MNLYHALGRLVRDPETRAIGGDQTVANISLAVNKKWKDKSGEWREDVLYIRATAWGLLAKKASGLKKGDFVLIVGSLEQRKWADKDGNQRESIEVKLTTLESINPSKPAGDDWKKPKSKEAFSQEINDDIPF